MVRKRFKRQGARPVAIIALAAMCLMAVAASATSSASGASSAEGVNVAAAQAALNVARALPKYQPLATGGPINASKLKGKLVYLIKYADFPYNKFEAQAQADGLKLAGVQTRVVNGDGTPVSWAAGINAAVAAHADGINLLGMNPGAVAPQIRAAQKAGLIVTSSNSWGTTTKMPPPIIHGGVTGTWGDNGRLYVDAAVAYQKGPIRALVITSRDIGGNNRNMERDFKAEAAKVCSGCTFYYVDQPVAKWSQLGQVVASQLTAHRDLNYIIPFFDSEIPFVQAGIRQAGVNPSSIKIVSGNGSAEILGMIKPGSQVQADVGAGVTWMGYAVATNMLRILGGGKPTIYKLLPRVFDQTNVAEAGKPPSYTKGFGDGRKWANELKRLLSNR